jgi:hypothetical protein
VGSDDREAHGWAVNIAIGDLAHQFSASPSTIHNLIDTQSVLIVERIGI